MRIRPLNRASVRRVVRKTRKTWAYEWQNYWRAQPIRDETVLYESFAGSGMVCNPQAIFARLHTAPEFSHLRHIWVLADPTRQRSLVAEFAGDDRVSFVRRGSSAYFRALATSKYLVNNATFPVEFCKRDGQVYLNTWHGTPMKTMGYDSPEGGRGAGNVVRNFLMADYLLSSSDFMTERMYADGYRLTNVFRGKVVTEGFPRVDEQWLGDAEEGDVRRRLCSAGVRIGASDPVVLYVPTWHGTSFHTPTNDVALLGERVRAVKELLPESHRVLLKVHQQVYDFALECPDLAGILVPDDIPTNQVLGLTDVLVTDYSSVCFDFLPTARPIIYFRPEQERHGQERGLYLRDDELPGPTATTIPELAHLIGAVDSGAADDPLVSHRAALASSRMRFAPKDDGDATGRVIDIVFGGRETGYEVAPLPPDGRESILIYLGGLRSNGITASVLNLLTNLDHDRFDVSAFYAASRDPERHGNEEKIDPRVRVFPRVGGIVPSKKDRWNRRRLQTIGLDAARLDIASMEHVFREEWRRSFGEARFDHVIDYSGYAPYWAFLLLQAPAHTHTIWLHSDMASDQMREVDGRRPHEANLRAVFSMYPRFDRLVSVSSTLRDVNADRLAEFVPVERHTFARNSIDVQRILRLGHGWEEDGVHEQSATALSDNLTKAVASLVTQHGVGHLAAEVERVQLVQRFAPRTPGAFTFVNVGRLSPEKNEERLIDAFDLVRRVHPRSRLMIVGSGPTLAQLRERVAHLGLSDLVTFAGQQANPFALMAESDCFVLSSDYEGHPMVLLEARVLGLPIVSTDFPSVTGALPDGTGLVVARDAAALAAGMCQAVSHQVPSAPFDGAAYNAEALAEFAAAIGAGA